MSNQKKKTNYNTQIEILLFPSPTQLLGAEPGGFGGEGAQPFLTSVVENYVKMSTTFSSFICDCNVKNFRDV